MTRRGAGGKATNLVSLDFGNFLLYLVLNSDPPAIVGLAFALFGGGDGDGQT